jgi:hypothetical protein
MKFDGKTYLATCISLQLKNIFKFNEISSATIVDEVSSFYKDNDLDISFGSVKYENEAEESECLVFRPRNSGDINISRIEIGNKHSIHGSPFKFEYNMLVTADFGNKDSKINCLLELSDKKTVLSTATIIIDGENDPYKGIYCIKMKEKEDDEYKTVVEYFDGEVLDTIKNNNGLYSMDELTSYSSALLKRVGFKPDKEAILDYWAIERQYGKEYQIVGNAFANGSRAKFNKWVDKVFVKKETINHAQSMKKGLG